MTEFASNLNCTMLSLQSVEYFLCVLFLIRSYFINVWFPRWMFIIKHTIENIMEIAGQGDRISPSANDKFDSTYNMFFVWALVYRRCCHPHYRSHKRWFFSRSEHWPLGESQISYCLNLNIHYSDWPPTLSHFRCAYRHVHCNSARNLFHHSAANYCLRSHLTKHSQTWFERIWKQTHKFDNN